MSISTFPIAADADDGIAATAALYPSFHALDGVASNHIWTRFTGITIPKDTVITSARIDYYGVGISAVGSTTPVSGQSGYLWPSAVDTRQTPGNPTAVSQVNTPASASINTPTPGVESKFLITAAAAWQALECPVTGVVQSLVNTYDYDNGEMVFYWWGNPIASTNVLALYGFGKGPTQAAKLVIDFVAAAAAPPTKTTFHHG